MSLKPRGRGVCAKVFLMFKKRPKPCGRGNFSSFERLQGGHRTPETGGGGHRTPDKNQTTNGNTKTALNQPFLSYETSFELLTPGSSTLW